MAAERIACQIERFEDRITALEKNCAEFKLGFENLEKRLEEGFAKMDEQLKELKGAMQLLRETVYGNGRLDSLITRVNILWFIVIGTITFIIGGGSLFAIIRVL